MADRLSVSRELLTDNGILCTAIDDVEAANLRHLLQHLFGKENELGVVAVCSNPAGRRTPTGFAPAHEYAMFFSKTQNSRISPLEYTKEQLNSYNQVDAQGQVFKWVPLLKGSDAASRRELRPRLFYPIFVREDQIRIPRMEWDDVSRQWQLLESPHQTETDVWPINSKGEEMRWKYKVKTLQKKLVSSELAVHFDRNDTVKIQIKWYLNKEGIRPKTWWDKKAYSATSHGSTFLTSILGDNTAFPFPKSIYLVEDCLRVSSLGKNDTVLDYFGGSGTTAHATINLNRQDNGKRKYILVEMGHHFNTALKPRLLKAIYAQNWKHAKPTSRQSTLSHLFKYQRIESYEDTLNNIQFKTHQNPLFQEPMLRYLLGNETHESPTLLNIEKLQTPFHYQLNIVTGLNTQTQTIDIPETFTYLLGLTVKTRRVFYDKARRYLVYRGTLQAKSVTIIWRETHGWHPEDWERDSRFIQHHKLTERTDTLYVNTDSIVPEAKALDVLFKQLMFSEP